MVEKKSVGRLWSVRDSGIAALSGSVADLSSRSTRSYLDAKRRAQAIERLYENAGIRLHPGSDLAKLLGRAKELSDRWLLADSISMQSYFAALFLDRVADAVLPLEHVPDRMKFLRDLLAGNLNLAERVQSKAKDTLWELELWAALRRRSLCSSLAEPDIVVSLKDIKIGIACKKLYSQGGVEKVLSQAVAQIESEFDFGIVAINLDDLTPADSILKAATFAEVSEYLNSFCMQFLKLHEPRFQKYLNASRIVAVWISTGSRTDVELERPKFSNARQSVVWTVPDLLESHKRAIDALQLEYWG